MFSIFKNAGKESIHIKDIDEMVGTIEIIDIREKVEVQAGMIKGAINIPMNELLVKPETYLKKDKKYYLLCQSGMRSSRAASALQRQGFDVISIKGGMGSYTGKYAQ